MNRFVRNTLVAVAAFATLAGGAAFAQDAPSGEAGKRPGIRAHKGGGAGMFQRLAQQLNLTDQQKQQLEPIMTAFRDKMQAHRQNMHNRFESVLTAEQRAQLEQMKAERGQGKGPRRGGPGGPFAALNLTDEQKTQMKSLREQGRTEMQAEFEQMRAQVNAVLTPEQQAQLQQIMEKAKERRGKRGGPRGGQQQ